jgi:glycosyltransferase involved in cell wall biosynthesis
MKIAINARFLQAGKLEGIGWYTYELCKRWVQDHPDAEFILIYDRPQSSYLIAGANVRSVVIGPRARHFFSFWYWFDVQIPRVLRQEQADVFFSPDNFLSLSTAVPTVLTTHDIAHFHYPRQVAWLHRPYYRWFIPLFLRKAQKIICVAAYGKTDLLKHFRVPAEKIVVVPNGPREVFRPLPEMEQAAVRAQFSQGQPYFFFLGAIHPRKNILGLLQAYDLFRAKSASPVKLLIAGKLAWQVAEISARHAASPYHQDIVFLGYTSEEDAARLMASALALTYLSFFEGFGLPVLEAMCTDTPLICSNTSALPEVAGEAALLVNPHDVEAISTAMLRIREEAELRHDLVAKGRLQRRLFSWDQAAVAIYEVLRSVANN